jgi:SET domain-containing protein
MMDKVFELRESVIEGKGMFARSVIKAGEVICVFQGKRITVPELKELYERGAERLDDPLQIADGQYLDLDEPYVFFNHSCSPNAGMKGEGTLFALRDIPLGEEITFDYSTTGWSDSDAWDENWLETWRVPCKCGSPQCRGEIREFQTLSQELKNRYYQKGAVMGFIAAKFPFSEHP